MANFDLLTSLEQYQPWDDTEAAHYAAVLDLLRSSSAAFDRQSYQPGHITGSTWIVAEDTGDVAMIYHRRLDRWLQDTDAEPCSPSLYNICNIS